MRRRNKSTIRYKMIPHSISQILATMIYGLILKRTLILNRKTLILILAKMN